MSWDDAQEYLDKLPAGSPDDPLSESQIEDIIELLFGKEALDEFIERKIAASTKGTD